MKMKLRCYHPSHQPSAYEFYILSKGNNAGRPLRKACPNCFALSFDDYDTCEEHYWLCFAMFQSRVFEPYLTGSVIPFLRLPDVLGLLETHYYKMEQNKDKFTRAVEKLVSCQQRANKVNYILYLLEIVHKSTLYSIMR